MITRLEIGIGTSLSPSIVRQNKTAYGEVDRNVSDIAAMNPVAGDLGSSFLPLFPDQLIGGRLYTLSPTLMTQYYHDRTIRCL